ncbi:MAG TPA: hypothetical protein VE338_17375 [Ktedonobacterales bacterium]|nr:hypothetical protein [Ktedonobacterales bacterium]
MSDEAAQPITEEQADVEAPPRVRRKPGPRPGTEAAKRGGSAARDKYGREFYSKIGSKGGSMVRERHGSPFYTEIGRRGGETTKRNLGTEHYSRIGRIGGKRAHGRHDDGVAPEVAAAMSEPGSDQQSPSA